MSSVLSDIMSGAPSPPPAQLATPALRQESSTTNPGSDDDSSSDSDGPPGGNGGPAGTQETSDAISAFTVNTARNLHLTANGENSLLQFSQVLSFVLLYAHDVNVIPQARAEIGSNLSARDTYQNERGLPTPFILDDA